MKKIFKNKKNIILLSVLISLLVILTVVLMLIFSKKKVEVIDLSGFKKDEILAWIKQNNLEDEVEIRYEFSNVIAEDELISQSIEKGGKIEKGFLIIISKGINPEETISIPSDFSKMSKQQLDEFFNKNKILNVEYKYEHHETIAKDKIISITPSVKINRSQKITVVISNGKQDPNSKEIVIPDFKSYTKRNIELWAEKNKINLTFEEVASDSIAVGSFVSQKPVKLTKVKQGSRLIIELSAGKKIKIPNLINKNETEINSIAKNGNFKVKFIYEYTNEIEKGISFSQDVSAGSSIKPTSFVEVKISKGKRTKLNFETNQSIENLKKQLQDKNLIVKEIKEFSDTVSFGKIIKTEPNVNSGNYVDPKTSIAIYISKGSSFIDLKDNYSDKTINDIKKDILASLQGLDFKANKTLKYSKKIEEGKIITHDTKYSLINGINYVESLGDFISKNSANKFNNMSEDEIIKIITDANKNGAEVTFEKQLTKNDSGCQWQDRKLLCKFKDLSGVVPNYTTNPCNASLSCTISLNEKINLNITIVEQYSETVAAGSVISQNPVANTEINSTSDVSIIISKGPEPKIRFSENIASLAVSHLSGVDANSDSYEERLKEFEKASEIIRGTFKDLNVDIKKTISTSIAAGKVILGDPENSKENEYSRGATVVIAISIGKTNE